MRGIIPEAAVPAAAVIAETAAIADPTEQRPFDVAAHCGRLDLLDGVGTRIGRDR